MTGYRALHEHAAWIDLSGRGLIRVSGEDSARLLHAMCTNDVQRLQEGEAGYAFFLNAQGRILADAWILHRGDHFLLDTGPETAVSLREHLDRFIIADDVTLEDLTGQYAVIAIEGPAAGPWDSSAVAISFTGATGWRHWIRTGARPALPQATSAEAEIVRLENGQPRFGPDISERFLVQETQQLQAVSFSKGCYLGQEIVERVRARGSVHKHLLPLTIETPEPPAAGAEFFAGGSKAGFITSAAYSPARGLSVALGYVSTAFEDGSRELTLPGGAPVHIVRRESRP